MKLVLLFLLSFPAFAKDVILFVNMNYSSSEWLAIKKIANERGQELVTVPPDSTIAYGTRVESLRTQLVREINYYFNKFSYAQKEELVNNIKMEGEKALAAWPKIQKKVLPTILAYREELKKIKEKEAALGTMDSQVKKALDKLRSKGDKVDILALSGHSDGVSLSSESSYNLSGDELTSMRKNYDELFSATRQVLPLGCYTNTEIANYMWRELFPSASMIAGFKGRAPGRDNPYAAKYITEVMQIGQKVDLELIAGNAAMDRKAVELAFRASEAVRITDSAIDYCTMNIYGIKSAVVACDDQWTVLGASMGRMDELYLGSNPKLDPPKQVTGTPLRTFYTDLQKVCRIEDATTIKAEDRPIFFEARNMMREKTKNMIFWWNLQHNFSKCNKEQLAIAQKAIADFGIKVKMPPLDGKTSRIEFMKRYNEVMAAIEGSLKPFKDEVDKMKDPASLTPLEAAQILEKIGPVLDVLKKFAAYKPIADMHTAFPLNWVEPDAPSCN